MAVERFTMIASASVGEAGATRPIDVTFVDLLSVYLNIEAASGTMAFFLEASINGFDWYQVPFDLLLDDSATATDVSAVTDKRNFDAGKGANDLVLSVFNVVPYTLARVRWIGPGATRTVTITAVGN